MQQLLPDTIWQNLAKRLGMKCRYSALKVLNLPQTVSQTQISSERVDLEAYIRYEALIEVYKLRDHILSMNNWPNM